MCRSMVDILSATAEIRQEKKKEERKKQDENVMCATPHLLRRAAIIMHRLLNIMPVQQTVNAYQGNSRDQDVD